MTFTFCLVLKPILASGSPSSIDINRTRQYNNYSMKLNMQRARHYLETTIISCKGSLDKAKTRLTRVCMYRTEKPSYFGNYDVKNDFKEFEGTNYFAFLPKLTKDYKRVLLIKNSGKIFKSNLLLQSMRFYLMAFDYLKRHDYCDGFIFIIDISETSIWQLITKMSLRELRLVANIVIDAYGVRLKGIHYVTPSKLVNVLVWMVKQVVSTKIASRIHVHSNSNSVADNLPLEILPMEYGGNERSIESLHDDWVNMLASLEFRSYMIEMTNVRIKETVEEPDNKAEKLKNLNID